MNIGKKQVNILWTLHLVTNLNFIATASHLIKKNDRLFCTWSLVTRYVKKNFMNTPLKSSKYEVSPDLHKHACL